MASDPDSDPEGAAMAAAMGFSSFGAKPAAKKRRFNPSTDAFVEGDALEKLDRGGKKGTGSGGNTIPLGRTRTIGVKSEAQARGAKQNDEEIALDDDEEKEEDEEEEDAEAVDTARGKPVRVSVERSLRGSSESSGGAGPRYMDTSEVAPVVTRGGDREAVHVGATGAAAGLEDVVSDAEKAEMQRRIDAILAGMDGAPPPPPSNDVERPHVSSVTPGTMPPPHATLPTGSSWGGRSEAASSRGGGRQRGGRGGQREGRWYEGYYDPAFNTNPWEALEKAKGLKPVGSWLEYSAGQRA
ncbi:hypothetical protein LZ554_009497 [Drepanopeziza brunnea f. sp. 'monogermtubi']|nr:hypothetical protein LZ554_009497 [Drepanopeziza brunnea f. sp. 'monogermtubi']